MYNIFTIDSIHTYTPYNMRYNFIHETNLEIETQNV